MTAESTYQQDFNSVIYTDEVEIMANYQNGQNLGIHFNGIYFDTENAQRLASDLNPIVIAIGDKGFHSKKLFKEKSEEYYNLMVLLTDIIIKNKVKWINFPFAKSSMKDKGLKPFFDLQFPNMQFQKSNYRAVGFYLYFHSIHYYQEKHKVFRPKIRIYTDKDEYLKVGSELHHDGKILHNLERIISTRGKTEPFLYLADLVGFMFGRIKTKLGREITDLKDIQVDKLDPLTKICLFNTVRIVQNGLFSLFNFWDIMPTE